MTQGPAEFFTGNAVWHICGGFPSCHSSLQVKFDTFVAEGRVLHNYASILEMLLRLRQTCDHPFLVLSRGDSLEYADLNKLGRKFLTACPGAKAPDRSNAEGEALVEACAPILSSGSCQVQVQSTVPSCCCNCQERRRSQGTGGVLISWLR